MFRTNIVVNKASQAAKSVSVAASSNYHTYTHQVMWRPPRTNTEPSAASLERRAKRLEGKTMTAEQFARTRKPFDFPVHTKLPISARPVKRLELVRKVVSDEFVKLRQMPRQVEHFKPGDKIAITMLNSLTEDKTQILKGTVIATSKGKGYEGRFTIRNNAGGVFYEISIPYWSPFIRIIEVLEKDESRHKKSKQGFFIRQWGLKDPRNRAL